MLAKLLGNGFEETHSSLKWKGASYPDIVQMMAMKDMRTATPSGHSVPFWMEQTRLDGRNFGESAVPVTEAGIMMITMTRPIMLNVEP